MFKKLLLSSLFTITFLYATSVDEIVINTLNNNYDLKSLEKSINLANEQIKISKNWQNPVLSFGVNDIWFNDTFSRDKEAMQAQFIGFSQVIPLGNKLDIKKEIAQKDKKIEILNLEDAKLKLQSKIYELSYNILVLEKKEKLLDSYELNIQKLEKLYVALSKYGKIKHNEILNTKVSFESLQLEKQSLRNMIENLYLKLEQVSYTKINNIDASLDMNETKLEFDIKNHPKILMQIELSSKYIDISKFENENKIPDVKVNVAYFQRDDRFNDYANVSLSIPLPIYKTEEVNSLKAKIQANKINNDISNLKQNFNTEVAILQNDMNTSYKNYNLILNKILPLKQTVQKYLEAYNSFDQVKPQESIKNLNELITYELKALDELQNYFIAKSKAIYFTKKAVK
jgi:outer membrane protein, heavy metal efflux system